MLSSLKWLLSVPDQMYSLPVDILPCECEPLPATGFHKAVCQKAVASRLVLRVKRQLGGAAHTVAHYPLVPRGQVKAGQTDFTSSYDHFGHEVTRAQIGLAREQSLLEIVLRQHCPDKWK